MLLLKTCYDNALSGTTHLVQRKTGKKAMERIPLLALQLSEVLKCGDDL